MKTIKWISILGLIAGFLPFTSFGYTYKTHENIPEDAFIFMEKSGSNQMRWVADYLKSKAGGRYEGTCLFKSKDTSEVLEGTQVQECGAIGISRVGGINPDYFVDAFWWSGSDLNWKFANPFLKNNYTSWFHFINLLPEISASGNTLKVNNYNDYDGYSYQSSWGFPSVGIDESVASLISNSQMVVDLPNCTHSKCSERYSIVPNGNPAIDYKQNDSSTPVGRPSDDQKKIDNDTLTNYNCFSDTTFINCPDAGARVKENDDYEQIPNVSTDNNLFIGSEDWVIYEPADNAATFYYHEFFLEGGVSRDGKLNEEPIKGRYYSLTGPELIYLTVVMHWVADMTQPAHIWSTIGFNHGEFETWVDERYGEREVGKSTANNYEDYNQAKAYLVPRQNRHYSTIEEIFMEQAFLTYHIRLRDGYDLITSTQDSVWYNAANWGVNNSIATMALVFEKGVLELRKHQ